MMWKPFQDIIVGYANIVNPKIFWNIYHAQLCKANKDIDNLITRQLYIIFLIIFWIISK